MSATVPCTPCCATPQVTNVPGRKGDNGNNGVNGVSAYSIVTDVGGFTIPAVPGNTVTVGVNSTAWMVTGQIVVAGMGYISIPSGPTIWGTFRVTTINSLTSVTLTWLNFSGDTGGATISQNGVISPEGGLYTSPLPINLGGTNAATVALALFNFGLMSTGNIVPISVYGEGTLGATAFTLTADPINDPLTLVNINGSDMKIVISSPGTWLLHAQLKLDYVGATFAASRTLNAKLRRSNNTAADVSNAGFTDFATPVITTSTYTHGIIILPPVAYTTANATDIIQLLARLSVVPSAGSAQIAEASILATKLY